LLPTGLRQKARPGTTLTFYLIPSIHPPTASFCRKKRSKTAGADLMSLNKTIVNVILIIVLSFLAYANTFNVPFHFDDKPAIVGNPIITDLHFFSSPSKAEKFKGPMQYYSFRLRYIGYLTFALNYKIHGLTVTGYHITNLFIHTINALFMYWLVILAFKTPYLNKSKIINYDRQIALFTAFLFVCHPLQTQAVTYIWQRVTSLATLFYILSLLAYIKWRLSVSQKKPVNILEKKNMLFYSISIIAAVLGMKTKEIVFTLPLIILLFEFMFFNGNLRRRIMYVIPLLLTMLIIPRNFVGMDKPLGDMVETVHEVVRAGSDMSRFDYLFTQFRVIVTYIRLLFLPIHQNLDYDYHLYHSLLQPGVFPSFLFLMVIALSGIFLWYRFRHSLPHTRLISFGIFWFFITLSVESSIIPIQDVIYEHRMYLPSMGVFLAITTMLFMVAAKLKDRWKVVETLVICFLVAIVIVLSGTTYARNNVWKDEIPLWEDVVSKSPNKLRGHNNLGSAYMSKGLIDKAITHYEAAVTLEPDDLEAHYNLGNAYSARGLFEKAVMHYETAITLRPDSVYAVNNLANVYLHQGLMDKAGELYKRAIRLNPGLANPYYNLGIIYLQQDDLVRAREHFERALQINPQNKEAQKFIKRFQDSRGQGFE
jgi:tetratricopeptide (TPR) repeat protein